MRRVLSLAVLILLLMFVAPIGTGAFSRSPGVAQARTQDQARLLQRFRKAQSDALRAAQSARSRGAKEAQRTLRQARKDWEKREKAARRAFFGEHKDGPSRRAYVQEFMGRRKEFLREQGEERARFRSETAELLKSLKEEHAEKRKEFETALDRGETPRDSLWPGGSPPR